MTPRPEPATIEQDASTKPSLNGPFRDPTRYAWFYFRVPTHRDAGPTLVELESKFNGWLRTLQSRCRSDTSRTVRLPSGTCSASRRLTFVPRFPWGRLGVELEIRHLQDVFVVMISVAAEGLFSADQLPSLTALEFADEPVSGYLGSLTVIQAEIESSDLTLETAAAALHSEYLGSFGPPAGLTQTGAAVLLPGPLAGAKSEGAPTLGAAFVYPAQSESDILPNHNGSRLTKAEEQLLKHMPLIGLCCLKAVNSHNRLQFDLSPAVQKDDAELQQLLSGQLPERPGLTKQQQKRRQQVSLNLKPGNPTRLSLSQLRTVSDELTTLRSRMTDKTEEIRREIHTVDVNRRNLQAAMQTWDDGREFVQKMLYENIVADAVLQADSDRDYAASTLKRADVFFDSLEASARCHEVEETRWVANVMAFLGAIAAADLVPSLVGGQAFEQLGVGQRLGWEVAVFVAAALMALGILRWRRSA